MQSAPDASGSQLKYCGLRVHGGVMGCLKIPSHRYEHSVRTRVENDSEYTAFS